MYAVRTLRRGSLSFLSVDNAADSEQLSAKTADLKNLLADFPVEEWCAPVSGPEQGFRNKAKMVVSGSVENHCSVCCIAMAHQKTFVTARFILPHLRPFLRR